MSQYDVKAECYEANLLLPAYKLIDLTFGNVSSHGPFIWGPTGMKAVETALAVEIVAEMALKTIQLSPQVQPISSHLLGKHFLRKHGKNAYYGQPNLNPSREDSRPL